MCVCHNCPGSDNPACVNPAHLFLGTHAENMADMARKGRAVIGPRHPSVTHPHRVPRGGNHHHAKLTEADVREIRRARAAGIPNKDIAARFGISPGNASTIAQGKSWQHVS